VIQTYAKWQGNKDGLYSLILWADSHGGPGSVELTPFHDSEWPEVLPPPSEFEPPGPYEPAAITLRSSEARLGQRAGMSPD